MKPMGRGLLKTFLVILLAGAATVAQAQTSPPAQQQPGQPPPDQPAATPDQPTTLSPLASPKPQTASAPYEPITSRQRLRWFIVQTIGPVHLLGGGILSAGYGTLTDHPKEYGSSWGGFGDRFGMRLT